VKKMNKSTQEIVLRTCGRGIFGDTDWAASKGDTWGMNAAGALVGGADCDRMFGRDKCEAANDAVFEMQRKAA